jgi:hypothetical protein
MHTTNIVQPHDSHRVPYPPSRPLLHQEAAGSPYVQVRGRHRFHSRRLDAILADRWRWLFGHSGRGMGCRCMFGMDEFSACAVFVCCHGCVRATCRDGACPSKIRLGRPRLQQWSWCSSIVCNTTTVDIFCIIHTSSFSMSLSNLELGNTTYPLVYPCGVLA